MKELLHSFEYKGIWRRLHFEVSDEGVRCRGMLLHNLLQSLLKAPGGCSKGNFNERSKGVLQGEKMI
jgi:hypothetical protein